MSNFIESSKLVAYPSKSNARRFCVAPMLDWTDRHCRYFHRLISHHVFLYTEMVTTGALLHGDRHYHLQFSAMENPVALQLGGSDPRELALCAKMAEDYGYSEVNLNVGCPSDRVKKGRFGVCLMKEPELVADCIATMQQAVAIPVSVKSRIGVDEHDSYQELVHFVSVIAEAGCRTFIIHARKAWLTGLSPKQNRDIPPLRYDLVHQIKRDFPQLEIILNGGITTLQQADELLQHVDGVMVGREIYHNPYLLAAVDGQFYGDTELPRSRIQVIESLMPYVHQQLAQGVRLHSLSRHLLGLFHGLPGARQWRRYLSEHGCLHGADADVLRAAMALVSLE